MARLLNSNFVTGLIVIAGGTFMLAHAKLRPQKIIGFTPRQYMWLGIIAILCGVILCFLRDLSGGL